MSLPDRLSPTTEDLEAPLPYIRRFSNHKPEEAKFSYKEEKVLVKSIEKTTKQKDNEGVEHDVKEIYKETTVYKSERKVTLKCYGHTPKEDAVCFFQCLTKMFQTLKTVYNKVSQAKERDATILFNAMDKMLVGTANDDWQTVLKTVGAKPENQDGNGKMKYEWETFKNLLAAYICTRVFADSRVYDHQVRYMENRHKPAGMSAKEWHRLFREYNTYLCYLFPNLKTMRKEFPTLTFDKFPILTSDAVEP